MESLIIFIIIGIISSIFSKFKQQQQEQPKNQMPPFNQNSKPSLPTQTQMQDEPMGEYPKARSFEDFAKEIFGENDAKPMPIPEKVEPMPMPVGIRPEKALEDRTQAVLKRKALENRVAGHSSTTGRMGARKEVERSTSSTLNPEGFIKPSSNSLVQAIVMAEVLGPPKARQKR